MSSIPLFDEAKVRSCKICETPSPTLGSIDFNKSLRDWDNYAPKPSGKMVYYNQCENCGFVYTCALDNWQTKDFIAHIYNEHFPQIDHGATNRELINSKIISNMFRNSHDKLEILDYGGGKGGFRDLMIQSGFNVDLFDPYVGENKTSPDRKYDLMTCYEVMEHIHDPKQTIREMASLLKDAGMVIFSTVLLPIDFEDRGLFWPYICPRAGHISIYSKKSLSMLWGSIGFSFSSFNEDLHIAFRRVPDFARHLFNT